MDNLEMDESVTPKVDNSQTDSQEPAEDAEVTKERYKQMIEGSKQEALTKGELAYNLAVKVAWLDANSLLELHETDPKMAEKVAKHYKYDSFDDAKRQISWDVEPEKENIEEKFETLYKERRAKEVHETSLVKAEKMISKLDEELQIKATSYFDKMTKWRTLDEKSALEYAEMATLYVSRDKIRDWKASESLAQLSSTGLGKSWKGKSKEPQYVVVNWELVLDSNNTN